MKEKYDNTNQIDISANISDNVILGKHNVIGKNVVIQGFKEKGGIIQIGDCNIINDNTRIVIGSGGLLIGDWNVFHNNMLVMGEKRMEIGHNCWFGQNTILDSTGGLIIENGVRVGMYSQIWTHVASGELIEGCTLFGERETLIQDDVWLVGSCIVSSGVTVGKRGVYLIGSNITKNTEPYRVYAGNPAKIMDKLSFYKEMELDEKLRMMHNWVVEFTLINPEYTYEKLEKQIIIKTNLSDEKLIILANNLTRDTNIGISYFSLSSKTYIKTLSELERNFYKFIYNNKARFIPTAL